MENILDDEPDMDSNQMINRNDKSEPEDNNEDEDITDGNEDKDVKIDFRRSLSSQDSRKKDYRSKKEIEEEEREKMQ